MSDWKFRRRQAWCTRCTATFAEGERHVSCLRVAGDDVAREDICARCWTRAPEGGELFFWFTRHYAGKRALQLDLGTLESLFVQLEGKGEGRVRELRYVLCLLLMRKRRLKLDRVTRGADEGGEAMIVHRPRRKEALRVDVFDLSPERMAELRGDLVRLLEGASADDVATKASETLETPDETTLAHSASAEAAT